MRKLITVPQENIIKCDNPKCGLNILSQFNENNLKKFINVACPKCGENLLTIEDYTNAIITIKTIKTIKFLNKWFSWLTIFNPKGKNLIKAEINTHKGINIKKL